MTTGDLREAKPAVGTAESATGMGLPECVACPFRRGQRHVLGGGQVVPVAAAVQEGDESPGELSYLLAKPIREASVTISIKTRCSGSNHSRAASYVAGVSGATPARIGVRASGSRVGCS
jgi:hypothetical protein